MIQSEIGLALSPLLKVFGELNIPYFICGSLASSTHGMARSTLDIDMVSKIGIESVKSLVDLLESEYFISAEMIIDAIKYESSFNLIHLKTMIKIDIFILKNEPYHKISCKELKKIL